jgi:uncharacterized protein YjbJ (UPF0337 family)
MNTDILQGKWREMKGKVKEKWGQLTDDDLDRIQGRSEQLIGTLQQRSGYSKDQAEQEYRTFADEWSRTNEETSPSGRR